MEDKFNSLQEELKSSFRLYVNEIAIKKGNQLITYKELDTITDFYAHKIENIISTSQSKIVILCKDILKYTINIISVIKSRNIFIPIDIEYPIEKIKQMIKVVEADCIITDFDIITELDIKGPRVLILDEQEPIEIDFELPTHRYCLEDPMYIFFTSGSTGIPKAILGKNKSLVHFIKWEKAAFNIGPSDNIGQITSPAFDPFLRDIFLPLLSGATIILRENRNLIFSSRLFFEWLEKEKITLLHCTPSIINRLCNCNKNYRNKYFLKYLLFAGQKIIPEYLEKWNKCFDENVKFINLYGPTETTLAKCCYNIERRKKYANYIPVGKPIPQTIIHILNDRMENCGVNVMGEIYIDTEYMTFGYLNKELNKDRFVTNLLGNNELLYKTGDYGFRNDEEDIVIVKRKDRQCKIEGIRIELDEIETELLKLSEIDECAIVYKDNQLCAYIVSNKKVNINEVKNKLKPFLITTCIPKVITQINQLPLTTNGKINYSELEKYSN